MDAGLIIDVVRADRHVIVLWTNRAADGSTRPHRSRGVQRLYRVLKASSAARADHDVQVVILVSNWLMLMQFGLLRRDR